ncbi:MAG TPA: alpha/beta family hydrolase [Longimicrobiales bacterium]|nr:alpha/beta family hydrolase [Longimicrobiales bacterium]
MFEEIRIRVGDTVGEVSGLLLLPDGAKAIHVLGHGAGAGMRHPFLERVARDLGEWGVATLRYQFPYLEAGKKRVDPPGIAEATVRAAIDAAAREAPELPLFAGGKSFGGRMTSQAMAKKPDARVRGLAFHGFPLHAPGRPGRERAAHLFDVRIPMLFLQGTRDALADLDLMREVTDELGARATLHVVEGGDHSFAVLKRSGRTADEVFEELADAAASWMGTR